MTPQERLDYLLSDVWQPTNATITVAEIVSAVGLDAARLVVGTIRAAAEQDPILAASYQALSTVGMSLSGADRQSLIDQLATAGGWTNEVREAVKALGGVWRKQWQVEGYTVAPTIESVTKQAIIDTTRTAINSKATAINAWLDAVDLSAYTEAELQAWVDGMLASEDGNP